MHIKEIENIQLKNKQKYLKVFKEILAEIKTNKFKYHNQDHRVIQMIS